MKYIYQFNREEKKKQQHFDSNYNLVLVRFFLHRHDTTECCLRKTMILDIKRKDSYDMDPRGKILIPIHSNGSDCPNSLFPLCILY